MAEELNLDHFDLGTFVDYVHALKQERDALRAMQGQGGEAVEVVGVVCVSRFKNNPAMENVEFHQSADIPPGQHDLMTVAQHQRILAAATHPADQVASAELLERLAHYLECSSNLTSADYGSEGYDLARELRALLAKP